MTPPPLPIATRELSVQDDTGAQQPLRVQVYAPTPDGACWACVYELGAPVSIRAAAYGEDSLQALTLALHAVQAHLRTPDLRDRVHWLGAPLADFLTQP